MSRGRSAFARAWLAVLTMMLALLAVPLAAQPQQGEQARQQEVLAAIDALFAEWSKPDSPGCAYGVMESGNLVYAKAVGLADLTRKVPLTPDSVFDLASMGKQFTAAAIALLVIDGKVALDDDVRKFVPELPDYGPDGFEITIGDLLHHESGLRDYTVLTYLQGSRGDDSIGNTEVIDLLARQKALNFPPGERFLYSNSNYVVLAEVVHRVTGETLPQFAQARLFAPLGMSSTRIAEPAQAETRSYLPRTDGFQTAVDRSRTYGDGHVLSTLRDLARWDANFYTGAVGGTALIDLLRTRGTLRNGAETNYGLGLELDRYRGEAMESHGGSMAGFRTQLLRFPALRVSVAVLCNDGGAIVDRLATQLADLYLADVLSPRESSPPAKPAEVKIDPRSFDAYVGDYRMPNGDSSYVLTVSRNGDRYFMQRPGVPPLEIFPSSETDFFLKAAPAHVAFHREADGAVNRLTVFQPSGSKEAVRIDRAPAITSAPLEQYVGSYASDELQTTWRIEVANGALAAIDAKDHRLPLALRGEDRFALPGDGVLVFERGSAREISGFELSMTRALNLAFERSAKIR